MTYLKNKSEFNLEGAQVLIDANYYAPSVHCSYYAVFQKLKYLFREKQGISYQELNDNIQNDKRRNTHKYIIEEFCNLYYSNPAERIQKRDLKQKIKDLKTLREKSDYDNIEIDISISQNALDKSKDIISIII